MAKHKLYYVWTTILLFGCDNPTSTRLAAHAVLDIPRGFGVQWTGLRRALRFAQTRRTA